MVKILSSNTFGTAKWIVSADSTAGTHTTITAALTSSSAGDTIFIRPGTYTEDLTLKDGVNIAAFTCDAFTPNVTIIGKASFTGGFAGFTLTGIRFQTNSDNFLAIPSAGGSPVVTLINCYLNCTNATGITLGAGSALLYIRYCFGDLGTTGIALFTQSSGTQVLIYNSNFTNSGNSLTASSSTSNVVMFNSSFNSAFSFTSGNNLIGNCSIICGSNNLTCITTGTGGTTNIFNCYLTSGTASTLSIGASTTVTTNCCVIDSTNTNPLTGAGTSSYSGNAFSNTGTGNNVTTKNAFVMDGGNYRGIQTNTAPAAGNLGEQLISVIASPGVSSNTTVTTDVTSVALTAGIWDVTGIISFTGLTTTTFQQASVNTTSATLGTPGDNLVGATYASTTAGDVSLEIPQWRVTSSGSTTVYLTGNATYSVGTGSFYGRLSAVRVA